MGASLATGFVFGSGASYYSGQKYGQGSWQQEALGTSVGLLGGIMGDAAASNGPRIIGGIKSGFEGAFEPGGLFGGPELAPAGGPGGFGSGAGPEIVPRAPGSPGMDAWNPPKNDPMQMSSTGSRGGSDSDVAGTPKTPQEVSQANYDDAVAAKASLPDKFAGKTVLSDNGETYLSGSGGKTAQLPEGYSRTSVADTQAYGEQVGYDFPSHAYDNGVPGSYYASHADAQALAAGGGETAGITQPVCGSCQGLYRATAIDRGQVLTPTDSNGTWSFNPDGTVLRPDGQVIGPDDTINPYGSPGGKVIRPDGSVLPAMPAQKKP